MDVYYCQNSRGDGICFTVYGHLPFEETRICYLQVTARQEQKYAAKRSLEEELALERKAEEDYEELLRREAEQLKIKDFAPKVMDPI